jgi:protein TonB
LRVERSNGELLLTWNRDADAIKNASKATLTISDGEQHENVSMDLAQLANGSIVYSPSGTDISFKMEVTDKNQKTTATETVRMLRTRPSPLNEAAAVAVAPGAKPGAAATGAPGTSGASPAPGATPNGAPVPAAEAPVEQPKPVTALKPFQSDSLSQRLRPAAASDLPDAPTVSAGNTGSGMAIPGVGSAPLGSIPAPVAPSATAAIATPSAPIPSANGSSRTGGQIQQAVLVYRKDAEYPRIAKQSGAKGTVVVSATIGTDGLIKKVKVISGHPMLSNAAVEAVKQWRYRPTLLNGTPVEAETQVSINFVGDGR